MDEEDEKEDESTEPVPACLFLVFSSASDPVFPNEPTTNKPVQELVPAPEPVPECDYPRRSSRMLSPPEKLEITGQGKTYVMVVKMNQGESLGKSSDI